MQFYDETRDKEWRLELQTKVREDFTIKEKAPTRTFSWLKVPTSYEDTMINRHLNKV